MSDQPKLLTELPKWTSHKVVQAARVTGVSEGHLPDILFVWHLAGGFQVEVDEDLARRVPTKVGEHGPIGGYFVLYQDGYRSWSPADAFDEGYTRVTTEA